MDSPKNIHEQLKRIDNIEKVAYDRIYTNYLKLNLKGDKKLVDIDSTDQESEINKRNMGLPLPGMIYTFWHVSEKNLSFIENILSKKEFEFHDLSPILFCTSVNPLSGTFKGLNLTLLPLGERLKFLQGYYEMYENFFDKVEIDINDNKIAINKKFIGSVLAGRGPMIIDVLSKRYSAFFKFGYRTYKFTNVKQLRMLEFEEWNYIPFVDARNAVKYITLDQIHKIYWGNKE